MISLRYFLLAAGTAGLGTVWALTLSGLWSGSAAALTFSGLSFLLALVCGHAGDGLRRAKAPVGKRALCGWTTVLLSLLGALWLPLGSELAWEMTLGVRKAALRELAAVPALLGSILLPPVLAAGALPTGRRKAALVLAGAALLCLGAGTTARALAPDALFPAWAGPAALWLIAAENGSAIKWKSRPPENSP